MARIIDQWGNPVSTAVLKTEQAAPTTTGVRRPNTEHQASGLTPAKLARLLRTSVQGDPEGYLALAEDNGNAAGGLSKLSAYAQAIKDIESSGGNYGALGPLTKSGDRAYGAYQVMGANIPSWTKSALGQSLTPSQFLGDKGAQDAVFEKVFGQYLSKYGNPQDAASSWFTGGPQSQGANATDILGTSGSGYVAKFNAALGKLGTTAIGATQNLGTFGDGMGQLGQNLSNYFPAAPSGGGGGGLGGLFGSLFGGLRQSWLTSSSPQAASLLANGAVGLFDKGGWTGTGAVDDPAGVVHRGEIVWSQRDIRNAGGVATVEAMRLGKRGYSAGGYAGGNVYGMPGYAVPKSEIIIQNFSNASVSTEETTDDRGGRQTKFVIADTVGSGLSEKGGGAQKAMKSNFGLKTRGIPR